MHHGYDFPYICYVCGGPGDCNADQYAALWIGVKFRHKHSEICARYLARQRRELDKERAALKKETEVGLLAGDQAEG